MSVDMDLILADEELVEVNLRVRNYKKDDRESMTAGADAIWPHHRIATR